MTTLYVEPFSGLAGDMFLGALAGLCGAYDELPSLPARLGMEDARVELLEVEKNGIACRRVKVTDLGRVGRRQSHASGHAVEGHRHLADILALIEAAELPEGAKQRAGQIFRLIGEAESEVHGIPVERIHFHEISAVDSIVDIVGSAWLLDRLRVEKCFSDPVCTGFGTVAMAHGEMPLPAPATALLLRGLPSYKGEERGERATPTGAAILRSLDPSFRPPPMRVSRLAYGPGEKDFRSANVLRLSLVDAAVEEGAVKVVETDLDDCTGETLGLFFQEGLLEAGALDFTLTHTMMKKGRPGIRLGVLVNSERLDAVSAYILENTSSIGLRIHSVTRRILPRRDRTVESPFGPIRGKEVETPGGGRRFKPDFSEWERLRRSVRGPGGVDDGGERR